MARIRTIKPDLFLDEDLAELNVDTRFCFVGLFCQADREGRLEDRPKKLKVQIFPYDNYDMDSGLQDLHDEDFITRYEVGGKKYIQINNFKKHQRPHHTEKESEIPGPDESLTVNTPLSDGEAPAGREGKGRERKGEGEGEGSAAPSWINYPAVAKAKLMARNQLKNLSDQMIEIESTKWILARDNGKVPTDQTLDLFKWLERAHNLCGGDSGHSKGNGKNQEKGKKVRASGSRGTTKPDI